MPAKKRKYGYFSLPLLHKDEFIGLIDCKADRKMKTLIVKNSNCTHTEKIADFEEMLNESLLAFAAFNDCETISREDL